MSSGFIPSLHLVLYPSLPVLEFAILYNLCSINVDFPGLYFFKVKEKLGKSYCNPENTSHIET